MSGNFNGHILVDKLSKLNSSQQSIETLSHWCIFHRKKAKQVVETWERQFHLSPRDRKVSFLYLANDILQNSRRKGSEFVVEFWKVLPSTLNDVLQNGDDSDKHAASRLIDIWEERKVFGSHGQALKEELMGRNRENNNANERNLSKKIKNPIGGVLEKIMSDYNHVYGGSIDEDDVLRKCHGAINGVGKVEKDLGNDPNLVSISGAGATGELQGHHSVLRESIEQLKATELSRAVLVSHLREALHDEELKLEQGRTQLQAALAHSEIAANICERIINRNNGQLMPDQKPKEATLLSEMTPSYVPESQVSNGEKEKSAPVMYTSQNHFSDNPLQNEDDQRKSTAAAVAAKLAASTESAQMLSYVLSSLASEGIIGQQIKDDNASMENKRPRMDSGDSYTPTLPLQPPQSTFPHADSFQQMASSQAPAQQPSSPLSPPSITTPAPPAPRSLPPLQPPLHPSQFMQNAGSMAGVPYTYGSAPMLQHQPPLPNYQMPVMAPYPAPPMSFQVSEGGGFLAQPPLPGTPPPFSRP